MARYSRGQNIKRSKDGIYLRGNRAGWVDERSRMTWLVSRRSASPKQ